MSKTITSTEAQNRFASMMEWTIENSDEVVIEVRGKPKAVLMSFDEYSEIQAMRKREQKRQALAALDKLRKEIRNQNLSIVASEAYRIAGVSPEVITEMNPASLANGNRQS